MLSLTPALRCLARLWLHAEAVALPHPDDGRALQVQAAPGAQWDRLQSVLSPT